MVEYYYFLYDIFQLKSNYLFTHLQPKYVIKELRFFFSEEIHSKPKYGHIWFSLLTYGVESNNITVCS